MACFEITPHVSRFLFGGHKAVVRPDPIPNSAVKHSLADGSSPIGSARVGSRQFFNITPEKILRGFVFPIDLTQKTGRVKRKVLLRKEQNYPLRINKCKVDGFWDIEDD